MKKYNSANFILYDRELRFLIQHRSADAHCMPGFWAFFGGGIKPGETGLDAVRREAREELRHELLSPEFVFEQDFELPEEGKAGHMRVYIDAYFKDKSVLELHEGQGWGWFNLEESARLKMKDHDRHALRVVMQFLQSPR
jgi:8-oxo-dGTP pyrophosphatase MutT (NUDIX family)